MKSLPILRQIDYNCSRPIVSIVDTSPSTIGWAIDQDDVKKRKFAIRFRARILTDRQRKYPQVKRELLGTLTTIKLDRNYLIEANVVLEID